MKAIPNNDRTELVLNTLTEALEDAIQNHHDSQSGETFQECMLCGEWDSHIKECPIPAIELWFKVLAKKDADAKSNNV